MIPLEKLYLKPVVDLGVTNLFAEPSNESGPGPMALELNSYGEGHLWVRPGAEVGKNIVLTSNTRLRPYIQLANRSYLTGRSTYVQATFDGAPTAASPMRVPIDLGSMFEGTAGVRVALRKMMLGGQYEKVTASNYNMNSFNFSLGIPF